MKKTYLLTFVFASLMLSGCKKILDIIKPEQPASCDCRVSQLVSEIRHPDLETIILDTVKYNYNSNRQLVSKIHSNRDILVWPGNDYFFYDAQGRPSQIISSAEEVAEGYIFGTAWYIYRYTNDTTIDALKYPYANGKMIDGQLYPSGYEEDHWVTPGEYTQVISYKLDDQKRIIKSDENGLVTHYTYSDVQNGNGLNPLTYPERLLAKNFHKYFTLPVPENNFEHGSVLSKTECNYPLTVKTPDYVDDLLYKSWYEYDCK